LKRIFFEIQTQGPMSKQADAVARHKFKEACRLPNLKKIAPLIILFIGLGVVFATGADAYFSVTALREHRDALTAFVTERYILAPVLFCAIYAISTALSVPGGALLTVSGGFLFGAVFGVAYSVLGATIGATLLFLAARTAFGDMLRSRAGSGIDRMREGFQKNALSYLLFLRLVPVFPFFLVNLVPAFLNVRLPVYVIGTFIGIIPGSLVFTLVGSGVDEIFARGEDLSLSSVFSVEMMLGFTGLGLLSLVPVIYKRIRGAAS
jgi:uncharacterized membrane protein YdjX (TVP38/TMEM64 family)